MKYENLLAEGAIGSVTLSNRVVMTAMETVMAEFDGKPSDLTTSYFYERAKGGVGLIITGVTRVNDFHGVTSPRQLSMSTDANIQAMKVFTDKIHETDAKIFCQLQHPGRQTYSAMINVWPLMSMALKYIPGFKNIFGPVVAFYKKLLGAVCAPAVVAPSGVPCELVEQKTRPLSIREIKKLVQQFAMAARRCKESGFDGVEIHAAHGYLVQQFLSPHTNKRTDQYGGSFDNRFRFLKEIILTTKELCGADFPVSVRVSIDEFYRDCDGDERGITLPEGLAFARAIEKAGADAISVTSGTYETLNTLIEPVTYQPGWRKYLAAEVKKQVAIPVIAANLIRSPDQAEAQLREGIQDFVGLGRPFLCDPCWVNKVREGREDEIVSCINCLHCFESVNINAWLARPLECARNPLLGHEMDYEQIPRDGRGRQAVVIGAGPAGMTAAEFLAKRGFKVDVLEKNKEPGGQIVFAKVPPLKLRIADCIEEMAGRAVRAGARFKYGIEATAGNVKALKPEVVICATGSLPIVPRIEGVEAKHVFNVFDVLRERMSFTGKNVVVAGSGLTGLEVAEYVAAGGGHVSVVEMLPELGPSAYHQNLSNVLSQLKTYQVQFLTSTRLEKVLDRSVIVANVTTKESREIPADAVILAIGNRKNRELYEGLVMEIPEVRIAGDAASFGKIADAVRAGYQAAMAVLAKGGGGS